MNRVRQLLKEAEVGGILLVTTQETAQGSMHSHQCPSREGVTVSVTWSKKQYFRVLKTESKILCT